MAKNWDKSKKEQRRTDDRDFPAQDHSKRKKLKPVEKSKYRLRNYDFSEEG